MTERHDVTRAFWRGDDGSWICVDAVTVELPKGTIQLTPGSTFVPGACLMGFDLARWLEEQFAARGSTQWPHS